MLIKRQAIACARYAFFPLKAFYLGVLLLYLRSKLCYLNLKALYVARVLRVNHGYPDEKAAVGRQASANECIGNKLDKK